MLFDLKNLATAKTKVQKKRVAASGNAYEDAVAALKEFEKDPDKEILQDAANRLMDSLQFNPDHAQSYVFLAYIFFVLGDDAFALKYMNTAESLCGGQLPGEIKHFKQKIIDNLPYNVK